MKTGTVALKLLKSKNIEKDAKFALSIFSSDLGIRYLTLLKLNPKKHFVSLCKFLPNYISAWIIALLQAKYSPKQIIDLLKYWVAQNSAESIVKCITATIFSENVKKDFEIQIKSKYPKANIIYETNPAIFGGMKLIFHNFVIDSSVQSRLEEFQKSLGIAE